jgi:organic hydroperoxide reductase OsmC/OhrA
MGGLLAPSSPMNVTTPHRLLACATETVWDGGLSGTGVCGDGQALSVGRGDGGWTPEQLLLLGAESSLMETILAAARQADIEVLGYVSCGHLDVPDEPGAAPRLMLRPCVVVASVDEAQRAALVFAAVAGTSLAGRLLGPCLQVGLDVRPEPSA